MLPNQMKHCTSTVISNIVQKYENNCAYFVALNNRQVWGTFTPLLKLNIFVEDDGNCTRLRIVKKTRGAKDKHFLLIKIPAK